MSEIKYYVLFVDQHTHFVWVYPLRKKSELFSKFLHFLDYVETQFNAKTQALQCDNGGKYNNHQFHNLFDTKGIKFAFLTLILLNKRVDQKE